MLAFRNTETPVVWCFQQIGTYFYPSTAGDGTDALMSAETHSSVTHGTESVGLCRPTTFYDTDNVW